MDRRKLRKQRHKKLGNGKGKKVRFSESIGLKIIGCRDGRKGFPRLTDDNAWYSTFMNREVNSYEEFCSHICCGGEYVGLRNSDGMFELGEDVLVPERVFLFKEPGDAGSAAPVVEVSPLTAFQGTSHHETLHSRHGGYLLVDRGINLLPESGDAAHHVGMNGVDCVLNKPRVIIHGYRYAFCQTVETPGFLQDVAHRKECH